MKVIDISMTLSENMMVYKNRPENKPVIMESANFDTHNHYESTITMNVHTGTHIDAPLHMIKGGETMSSYSIEQFVNRAQVLDLTHIEDCITESSLKEYDIEPESFVLLKTKNSYDDNFNEHFIYLEKSGAEYLISMGVKGVGTDALGIERSQPNHETHKKLFENKIMIIEGLRLYYVEPGPYQLIVLPLKWLGLEAAPARAILIQNHYV